MSTSYDLTGDNGLVRKTDTPIQVTYYNKDNSDLTVGTWTGYFTVRQQVPATSVVDDSSVVIQKIQTVSVSSGTKSITIIFPLTQTDLNIDPAQYFYDIKLNDPSNTTTPLIPRGYAILEVYPDITRSNT